MWKLMLLFVPVMAMATNVGHILHIGDIHLDLKYSVGSPTECLFGATGLGCCRSNSIPLSGSGIAGIWGNVNCDTAPLFLNATLQWAASNLSPLDAIIWTGDSVDHHDVTQTWVDNYAEIRQATRWLQKYFRLVPVVPCLGNHDTYPIDQLYPESTARFYLPQVADLWQSWLTDDSFEANGFYTMLLFPAVRVVVVNSLYWDRNNEPLWQNKSNVNLANQAQWVEQTLRNASLNGETVWMVGHIPPGASEATDAFSDWYQAIGATYASTIKAHFFAHSHRDQVRLIRATNTSVVGTVYIASSVLPDDHFPGLRVYHVDKDTGDVLDYDQYWLNWTQQLNANDTFVGYQWEYSARQAYGLADLSPGSWATFDDRMRQDDALFQVYYQHYQANDTFPQSACDTGCKQSLLCDLEWINATQHQACMAGGY